MRTIDAALGMAGLIKDILDLALKLAPYMIDENVTFEIKYLTNAFVEELCKPIVIVKKGNDVVKEVVFKDIWFSKLDAEALGELLEFALSRMREVLKQLVVSKN